MEETTTLYEIHELVGNPNDSSLSWRPISHPCSLKYATSIYENMLSRLPDITIRLVKVRTIRTIIKE